MISSNQVNQVESSFVLNIRADDRDRGRLRRRSVTLKDGTSPKCQPEGCDYMTVVGLATQDPVLKNLELHLRFHETNCERKLHLKLHELTTDQTESAVESLNETNCGGRADLTSRQIVEEEQTSLQEWKLSK